MSDQTTPSEDAPELPDYDLDEDEIGNRRRATAVDPVEIAARLMLQRAIYDSGAEHAQLARDGVIACVTLPDSAWVVPARNSWHALVRGNDRAAGRFWKELGGTWLVFCEENEPRKSQVFDDGETFAKAVSLGRNVTGFAADLTWLPRDLVTSADYRFDLLRLNASDVDSLAREMCEADAEVSLSDDQAAALTPRLLRLARRVGQTADEYVLRLRMMLEREAVEARPAGKSPRSSTTLDRLHGMDEAREWGLRLANDLIALKAGTITWHEVDRGCLLSGPPGCGKTLFARALAATCGVPLVTGSYDDWHGSGSAHQGDLLKAMHKTFSAARTQAPAILFIDEIDSFPNRATITHHYADWETQVVNALLAEIDGVEGRDGVVLIGACNHPDKLDPALVRSGRLDRHIRIQLPGRTALAAILREHLRDDLQSQSLSGAALSALGSSGADCERFVRGARRRARLAGREMVIADLVDEIGGEDERSAQDRWRAAVHEAGHVVVTAVMRPGTLTMATLRVTDDTGGQTISGGNQSNFVGARDIKTSLMIQLAGRAAEEEVLGTPSSGAGGGMMSDLAQATTLAALASTAFGLDANGELVWRGAGDTKDVPKLLRTNPALASRVGEQLTAAYCSARDLLRLHLSGVFAVASALLAHRVLDGRDAEEIVLQHISGREPRS